VNLKRADGPQKSRAHAGPGRGHTYERAKSIDAQIDDVIRAGKYELRVRPTKRRRDKTPHPACALFHVYFGARDRPDPVEKFLLSGSNHAVSTAAVLSSVRLPSIVCSAHRSFAPRQRVLLRTRRRPCPSSSEGQCRAAPRFCPSSCQRGGKVLDGGWRWMGWGRGAWG
jgi:hypothetical protein